VNTRATGTTAHELPAADNASFIMPKGRQQKRSGHAVQSPKVEDISSIRVIASILHLDHGLYVLTVSGREAVVSEQTGIALPAVHISKPPSDQANGVEIIASSGDPACWLDSKGGMAIVKAPLDGGPVLITSYRHRGEPDDACRVAVRRIDPPTPELTATRNDKPALVPLRRRIKVEILLHMEGIGDRRMSADGWVGNRGRKLRIEAFGIYPMETLAPRDIEYRAFGPNGRETPWIGGGKLCGTRGRSLPLTGFAIRLAAPLRERVEIEYHGAFFESGLSGPFRDGEPCMAGIDDDPLEAIDLHLFELSDPSKFTSL
jgi:hypothetical protein